MAISLKHLFQSAKTDGPDNTIVQPSDWNDEHVLTQATGKILGRTTAGAGATEEISPGTGITLSAGTISADVTSVAGRTGAVTLSTADISGLTTGYVQKTSSTGAAALPASTTGDRPGTPLAGYIRYNTTTGKFEGFGSAWGNIGGGAAIGDTPPANPGAGDLWWNSADGRMYVYYTDANSSQWVDLSAGGAGQYLPLTGGTVTGTLNLSGALVTTDGTSTTRVLNSGGVGVIGTQSSHPLVVQTNNAEQMRIDASGNVGIGTTSPSKKFELKGDAGFRHTSNAGGTEYFDFGRDPVDGLFSFNGAQSSYVGYKWLTNGTERVRIDNAGTFYVGGTSPSNAWFMAGGVGAGINSYRAITSGGVHHFLSNSGGTAVLKSYVDANAGAYVTVSDENLKTDIEPARQYLNDLNRIEVVKYRWKTDEPDSSKLLGVIAQQVETVFPGLVKTHTYEDGREQKMVAMDVFVPMLLTAVQELKAELDTVKSELATLKGGE